MARREKKPVHHVQMTDGKRAIIQGLLSEYDIQEALKDLLGCTIKERRITILRIILQKLFIYFQMAKCCQVTLIRE